MDLVIVNLHRLRYNHPVYRLTAGVVLMYSGKILSGLKHAKSVGYWNMPQGGIERGESPFDAAKRELLEETGISHEQVEWRDETDWYICVLPKNIERGKRYQNLDGQKYKWFLGLCAEEPEVKLCTEEYLTYKWADPQEVLDDVKGSFKEPLYTYVLTQFKLL